MRYLLNDNGLQVIEYKDVTPLFESIMTSHKMEPEISRLYNIYMQLLNMDNVIFSSPSIADEAIEKHLGKVNVDYIGYTSGLDSILLIASDKKYFTLIEHFYEGNSDDLFQRWVKYKAFKKPCMDVLLRNKILDEILDTI